VIDGTDGNRGLPLVSYFLPHTSYPRILMRKEVANKGKVAVASGNTSTRPSGCLVIRIPLVTSPPFTSFITGRYHTGGTMECSDRGTPVTRGIRMTSVSVWSTLYFILPYGQGFVTLYRFTLSLHCLDSYIGD